MGSHLVDNDEKMKWFIYASDIHSKYSVFYPIDQFSAQLGLSHWCNLQMHKAIFDNLRVREAAQLPPGFIP